MSLLPNITPTPFIKPSIPVGAGFDMTNGTYYLGTNGEMILSGGFSYIMGVAAKGNVGKSTWIEWLIYTAMSRVTSWIADQLTAGIFYDTELNKNQPRMTELMVAVKTLAGRNLFDEGRFTLTDKAQYSGNKFFEEIKTWLDAKRKDKKNMVDTPFVDRDGVSPFRMYIPTFTAYDSITEFDTDDIDTVRDKTELGQGAQNIINMRAGLVKTNFLAELPRVTVQANNYTALVAQIGKNLDIASGPHSVPRQQLKFLNSSEAIKGATTKFTFATHDCWWIESSGPLWDDDNKPEYPMDAASAKPKDTDLVLTKMRQLRSKGGPSGIQHDMLVSQKNGPQPELTEFHYLRTRKRWGMEVSGGGGSIMAMQLYPDVKVTRNNVRQAIDKDYQFTRALNFTMEMKQMEDIASWFWVIDEGWHVQPDELYRGLIERGYDWKILLNTRGYWCLGANALEYLSTMDLFRMYHGIYHPHWYERVVGKEANDKVRKGPKKDAILQLDFGPLRSAMLEAVDKYGEFK